MATHPPATAIEQAKVCALLNCRYHTDREAWFDWCHRALMFGVIIAGSGALLDVWPWLRSTAALITVLFGTLDLVFSLTERARAHSFLRKRYFEIAAQLEGQRANAAKAQSDMMKLAADEEPPYYAVHAIAENWAVRAVLGPTAPLPCKIGWLRKRLRHLVRFEQDTFACI